MNIFKVLASSYDTFRETQASIMLAWLLNPNMEHGLGFVFLKKILEIIIKDEVLLKMLKGKLIPVLRSGKHKGIQVTVDIEYEVGESRIDVVVFIDDQYIFAIENKIYLNSVESEGEELKRQYEGLKSKCKDYKIFMIFLVPSKDNEKVKKEDENLVLDKGRNDEKIIIEWEDIRKIIHDIIEDENNGNISPVDEYVRQTLKAFSNFIKDDFSGYYYETKKKTKNPLSEGFKEYTDIKTDTEISYVGVKSGILGLFKQDEIEKNEFQYTTKTIERWIPKEIFVKIVESISTNEYRDINWIEDVDQWPSAIIYRIAKDSKEDFYIGIGGGIDALKKMNADDIKNKKWGLSLSKKSKEWIKHTEYLDVINTKKVFP
jgi:hypothetical protein